MSAPMSGKYFALITGASSGFGQAIAQLLMKESGLFEHATAGSKILLVSRNSAKMEITKSLMLENGYRTDRFEIEQLSLDLSKAKETQCDLDVLLGKLSKEYDHCFLFNNAGSVGDVSKTSLEYDWGVSDYQTYFNLNLVNPIQITTKFCQHFVNKNPFVVQVSSLAAVQPMPYMHMYCTAKSGMDMFMRCLAQDNPTVKTLNYAPGPLDTDMGRGLSQNSGSESVQKSFQEMFDLGTIVQPLDSAKKLMGILKENKFTSGAHIDYFDE